MRLAGEISARAFVRWRPEPDGLGLCSICQEGYDLGGYGVLCCGHIMHLQCWFEYEAHERGQAPNRVPRCSICAAPFEGFGYICL